MKIIIICDILLSKEKHGEMSMKKISLLILVFAVCIGALLACSNDNPDNPKETTDVTAPKEKGVRIDAEDTLELKVGEKIKLSVINLETEMQTLNVMWSSDNPTVASVTQTGEVNALSEGNAVLTVSTLDGKYTDTCTVNVSLTLNGVKLNYEDYDMEIGDTLLLVPTLDPLNFEGVTYTWMSSVPSVASVDENGRVTAHTLGSTSIMVETAPGEFTAICNITVGKNIQSIELRPETLEMYKGVSVKLSYEIFPSDATARLFWTTSDPSVAVVNSGGVVTAKGSGVAEIKVSTASGLECTCTVTVISSLDRIEFNIEKTVLKKGETKNLRVTFFPSDATNKNLIWSSSDPSVAEYRDGKIYALSNGSAVITAVAEDGTATASCTVMINNTLEELGFEGTKDKVTGKYPTLTMQCTDVLKASLVASPADADELSDLLWSSSNKNVLTVSKDGTMTALSEGVATVKVQSTNGLSASFDVVVTKKIVKVEQIITTSDAYYLYPNSSVDVGLTYFPAESIPDAKLYSFGSTNEAVAKYDPETGKINAYAVGSCSVGFAVVNYDKTQVIYTVKITVVENGTNLDNEYKKDTHALRDSDAYKGMKEALDTVARLSHEKAVLSAKLLTEKDQTLIDEYKLRLSEVENGLKLANESCAYYKATVDSAEKALKAKYSSVSESVKYDPSADKYPEPSDDAFVKVTDYIYNIKVDLKYAGTDNETGFKIYNFTDAYLRYGTVKKLAKVAEMLEKQGYTLVLWDAYRPDAAQKKIAEALKLAYTGADISSCGGSLCIKIINIDGSEIEMPSKYGDMTALSDRDYTDASDTAGANAFYLETLMKTNGFTAGAKWWSFTDTDSYACESTFLADKVVESLTQPEIPE